MSALGFELRDWSDRSPVGYRRNVRPLSQISAAVLHQMGVGTWHEGNPMFARVRSHFVVLQSGLVLQLHPITARLRFGSGLANPFAITIEHAGNYPLAYRNGEPRYWKPEKFGRSVLADAPAQVEASRALLAWLKGQVPGLQVGAHRQIEERKSGCCGPDLWREIGRYSIDTLGLAPMPTHGGLDIPDDWRGPPRIFNPSPVAP